MKSHLFSFAIFLLTAALPLSPVFSVKAAQEIGWEDLLPEVTPIPDPYDALENDQIIELGMITEVRRQIDLGFIQDDHPNADYARELEAKLLESGLDVDDLLAADLAFQAAMEAQNAKLVETYNGQEIRMPGFAIPLNTVDAGVTELLLVPYVGACIHVPAPPPNQLVVVTLEQPFEMTEFFTPIWVTGIIQTKANRQEIWLVDGLADVDTGYSLTAATALHYNIE